MSRNWFLIIIFLSLLFVINLSFNISVTTKFIYILSYNLSKYGYVKV